MIDSVLSYHMNPATCGVARFNHMLAERLGVPCLPLRSVCRYPLLSIKPQEMPSGVPFFSPFSRVGFDLFLHGPSNADYLYAANYIYAGSAEIADAVRPLRSDVIEAFCPSMLSGNATRGAYRVLVFGMTHKILYPRFARLKEKLDAEHPNYTVELTTAVHEGAPWASTLQESADMMREIFGDRLRVLGSLADDGLARVLQEVDAVAAFYVPALRANNTTAWATLEAGKVLYTNLDALSPPLNVAAHSWDRLLEIIRA